MNNKLVYAFLLSKSNRNNMIKKIENGLKYGAKATTDPEVEKFQKEFLANWENLANIPSCRYDLENGMTDKQLKMQFCEWISQEDSINEGMVWAHENKEKLKNTITKLPKKIFKKN